MDTNGIIDAIAGTGCQPIFLSASHRRPPENYTRYDAHNTGERTGVDRNRLISHFDGVAPSVNDDPAKSAEYFADRLARAGHASAQSGIETVAHTQKPGEREFGVRNQYIAVRSCDRHRIGSGTLGECYPLIEHHRRSGKVGGGIENGAT